MNAKTVLMVAAALGVASGASAQVWDAPSFLPPRPGEDVGVYVTWPDGANFGIQGIWRQHGNLNLGVRVGYLDRAIDGAFLVGAETWGGLVDAGRDFPVDVSWTLGAGATFGDFTVFSIPVGVSIGRALVLSPLTFQLYGHPRLAVVVASAGNNTTTDLEGLIDLGADLHLNPDWKLRLGVTLGETDALGLGLAYRFGRGVAVR
ncbi:MAG TPA: hypothetical protein VMM12_06035 [Longimicrobiales bacterium]|nr:hypothetical protein [Longimicrobiales bacterium]